MRSDMFLSFGALGTGELIIIILLAGSMLIAILTAGIVLFFVSRSLQQPWKKPFSIGEPVGSPQRIRRFESSSPPLSRSARWNGEELHVQADEWATKSLFDVQLEHLDQCKLTYRFQIQTENIQRVVYPEMWCRIPDKGMFFSRGVDRKIRGMQDWTDVEIPFYLQSGQRADLLHLNLVFEGPGSVKIRDMEVLVTSLKPAT